ncbi:undecaprenyldiphospho-muramoylpentapeptide beta-N-acetylglucosaminyltransferase [Lottiidibacillus patelloidae]|uniref:UDP-N-acetylglucosamine--N-acetylmuramyl-(pentapeptide) pyrophosphoryl-undecaprenol N-acetylglucosamine transferase n=1 Tax=Lottiidibacillus patelloidae TaxID=2670334 RepID=A0A263BSP4_9BACI|nr:undecaprenyldiphospho-muramoylpentapeptide beta-N-acetylglucosaminyltransferase [Lottiidibacillus patelloidae]OZM56206.1 undecaprenyldiphospho-muramoylpentapeptide beta-N-acetylglucosaminyltransferase [Lottiidibacillus patelloidae]
MKKIILTGGGSAGHVTPNLALISKLNEEKKWEIHYIGSKNGIERELINETKIPYHPISSGKLRRYIDLENIKDPFKVLAGVAQSYRLIRKLKPQVVFSKGGFVSVPVVIGAWLNKVPVYIHESDLTPGLANKIAMKFSTKVFTTFDETIAYLPKEKAVHTGSPIREAILKGNLKSGLSFLDFDNSKPIITIMGGSLGSLKINEIVRAALPELLKHYQIVHLCGKGKVDEGLNNTVGYRQYEYLGDELPDILAATNYVISRAGSNSIFEFLTLKKPMLLIPLSRNASRGDQILNAESFKKKGFASVIEEEDLTTETLIKEMKNLHDQKVTYIDQMYKYAPSNAIETIANYLNEKN